MSVRLKIEDSRDGLVATISQRDDTGSVIGPPSVFLVGSKEEAKHQAKTLVRSLGLKVYGIVDKSRTAEPRPFDPQYVAEIEADFAVHLLGVLVGAIGAAALAGAVVKLAYPRRLEGFSAPL